MPRTKKAPARRQPRRTAAALPHVISIRGFTNQAQTGLFTQSSINTETAIRVTSILAVVRWIAQAVAVMPLQVMRTLGDGRKVDAAIPAGYVLKKRPNAWQSAYDFYQLITYWTALHGNAFARIIPGERGWMNELRPLHPTRVEVDRAVDYTLTYRFLDADNRWKPLAASEVLHWRWLSDNGFYGLPPAELCGTSIGLARRLDAAATSHWDNSGRPDMVLETDEKIPDQAVEALREALHEIYGGASNRGKTAVLPKKTRLKAVESNTMEQSQFQELRDSILADICRCWGVPSTLLGDHRMARWSNVEQEHLSAQVWGLLPWQRRIEGPIDMALQPVHGEDVYCKLDNRGLLRADTASRVSLYSALWTQGAITPNEIRDLEDLPLLDTDAANETYVQLGFSTLDNAAASAVPQDPQASPVDAGSGSGSDLGPGSYEASQGSGYDVEEAGGFAMGQYVYWAGGEGTIEHLMTDGTLGVEGSPFAIKASPESPAALIRVHQNGKPTEMLVGKKTSELSAEPVGGSGSTDPAASMPPALAGADLAATALNGAQVTALLEVLSQVSAGALEQDAAVALITSAFPTVSEDLARQMVSGARAVKPPPQGGAANA